MISQQSALGAASTVFGAAPPPGTTFADRPCLVGGGEASPFYASIPSRHLSTIINAASNTGGIEVQSTGYLTLELIN